MTIYSQSFIKLFIYADDKKSLKPALGEYESYYKKRNDLLPKEIFFRKEKQPQVTK